MLSTVFVTLSLGLAAVQAAPTSIVKRDSIPCDGTTQFLIKAGPGDRYASVETGSLKLIQNQYGSALFNLEADTCRLVDQDRRYAVIDPQDSRRIRFLEVDAQGADAPQHVTCLAREEGLSCRSEIDPEVGFIHGNAFVGESDDLMTSAQAWNIFTKSVQLQAKKVDQSKIVPGTIFKLASEPISEEIGSDQLAGARILRHFLVKSAAENNLTDAVHLGLLYTPERSEDPTLINYSIDPETQRLKHGDVFVTVDKENTVRITKAAEGQDQGRFIKCRVFPRWNNLVCSFEDNNKPGMFAYRSVAELKFFDRVEVFNGKVIDPMHLFAVAQ